MNNKIWTPVEDGWHDAQDAYAIYVWGDKVTFHDSNTGYEANWYFPDELRFCRATAAEATGVPQSIADTIEAGLNKLWVDAAFDGDDATQASVTTAQAWLDSLSKEPNNAD